MIVFQSYIANCYEKQSIFSIIMKSSKVQLTFSWIGPDHCHLMAVVNYTELSYGGGGGGGIVLLP